MRGTGFVHWTLRMSHFTEVVYRIKNGAFPICAYTERNPEVKVIVNPTSFDAPSGRCRAVLSFVGPEAKIVDLARETERLCETSEGVLHSNDAMTIRVTTSLDTLRKSGNPAVFGYDTFGELAVQTPSFFEGGYLHSRLLVTGPVDLPGLLGAYDRGLKEGRWDDFKLLRIDEFDAARQMHGAFAEGLTPKQLEVIKTALALGFYNSPRGVNLDDLSNIFGISKAAVHNRLKAAERKVVSHFFS